MPREVGSNKVLVGLNWLDIEGGEEVSGYTLEVGDGTASETERYVNALNYRTNDFWRVVSEGRLRVSMVRGRCPEFLASFGQTSDLLRLLPDTNPPYGATARTTRDGMNTYPALGSFMDGGEFSCLRFRLLLSAGQCSVIHFGELLEFPRPIYENYRPLRWSKSDEFFPRISRSGHFLGTTRSIGGKEASLTIRNVDASWIRENEEKLLSLEEKPFFLWWRPDKYPNEVEYCWLRSPLRIENTGPAGLMRIRMELSAA